MPRAKTVKKATSKVAKKVVSEAKSVAKEVSPKKFQVKIDRSKFLKGLLYVVLFVVAFGIIDLLVQYLNNDYSVAVVNGQRISKNTYYDRLSKAYGLQASSTIIDEELIKQEGEKEGIEVSKKDIDNRIKEIVDSIGGEKVFEDTLKSNNLTRKDVERQIEIEIIYTKILEPSIKYEDKDIKAFFDQYKDYLYEGQEVKYEDKKTEVEQQYLDQKIEEAKQTWLTGLRDDAKVQNNIKEKPKYGFFKTVTNIFNNIFKEAKNSK